MKTAVMACTAALVLIVVTTSTVGALEHFGSVPAPGIPGDLGVVPDEFIVVLSPGTPAIPPISFRSGGGTGLNGLDRAALAVGAEEILPQFPGAAERGIPVLERHYKIRLETGDDLQAAMRTFVATDGVERVEPIGIHAIYATPNDGFYPDQWHLNQANDHDVDAPEAWDIETGDPSVVVAVLDTGVRYFHKDLGGANASYSNPGASRGNMWINNSEMNGVSGVDDDGNGYVDDWIGYDFVTGVTGCITGEDCSTPDNDPRDFNGHGTHCAGIIGAINNNGYASCSPAGGWGNGSLQELGNGVKVMAMRIGWSGSYLGQEVGYVRMDFAAQAFYYAADNGARIASCSWGSSNSGGIDAAVTYFVNGGGLIFKAAGNANNQTADYLCARSDVISVASTDENDCKSSFSSYGTWVDISAPGSNILSSYHSHDSPANDYVATMSGTSMATPLAASIAALIWSQNTGWNAAQVRQRLYDTADPIDGLSCNGPYAGKLGVGRVNAFQAVQGTGPAPPVAAFSGSPLSGCAPLGVSFLDESTGEVTSWSWTFGDGGSSTAQHPVHTYTVAGTYEVSLTVTGPGGSDTETKPSYIQVSAEPVAAFAGTPTSGAAPLTVNFADASTGNPTGWSWNFGDGGTSTAQNPAHTFTSAGDYTVSLTASNACGSDALTRTAYIHVTEPSPIALAEADVPVTGTVAGTYVNTHASDGVYEVITEVSSNTHPRKWYSQLEHRWPFTVMAGTAVTFRVEAYRPDNPDGDDFVFEYSTDGSAFLPILTVNSPVEQVYSAALPSNLSGPVSIRVVDTNRVQSRQSLDAIHIDAISIETSTEPLPPVADFLGEPTAGAAPLQVQFSDLSQYGPTSWSWTFGDGGTSSEQSPAHTYQVPGTYTVSLTATNGAGSDVETKTDYITVTDPQSGTMHVQEMQVGRKVAGPNHSGTCTISIFDAAEQPVSGASVSAAATGPVPGTFEGVTGADGSVYFETGKMKNPTGEWCFEVSGVTHPSLTYDPAGNHMTQVCESGIVYADGGTRVSSMGDDSYASSDAGLGSTEGPDGLFLAGSIVRDRTVVTYRLGANAVVSMDLYNIGGTRVRRLADGWRPAGLHGATLDATGLPSGVYFLRLQAGTLTDTRRVVVVR